jgi:glucose/arabinose dehydrogenase
MTDQKRSFGTGALVWIAVAVSVGTSHGQFGATPLSGLPRTYETPQQAFRVVMVADGLEFPWSLAFLPDGSMLVTERPGRLRIIRNGILDPEPVAGVPEVYAVRLDGLLDIVLHPRFAENGFAYLAYAKPGPPLAPGAETLASQLSQPAVRGAAGRTKTVAVARGRWDGTALVDVRDIFVADNWIDDSISQTSGTRMVFGRDGMLNVGMGAPNAPASSGAYAASRGGRAQDPGSHAGKVLRLRDDGTVPSDNPFVGRPGYKPEIYTLGHRQPLGLAVHPQTGEIWEHENGPQDGDEVNVLRPGANYGWPVVGMGRDYSGDFIGGPGAIGAAAGRPDADRAFLEGMAQPFLYWVPAVAPSGMTFYTGDRFPDWQGNLFIGVMKYRRLERHVFNENGQPTRREYLLEDLGQRIRDVRQGPDGLLYLLTDHNPGAVLRLEPAE